MSPALQFGFAWRSVEIVWQTFQAFPSGSTRSIRKKTCVSSQSLLTGTVTRGLPKKDVSFSKGFETNSTASFRDFGAQDC